MNPINKILFLAAAVFSVTASAGYESGSANQVLRVPSAGGRPRYGQVDVGQSAAVTGTLPLARGGTGISAGSNQVLLDGILPSQGSNSGKFLGTNGTTASWGAPAPTFNYTSQSSAYQSVISDWVFASGSSFNVTLPTATGNAGKSVIVQHNGTSMSNVYTLLTNPNTQTISGVSSGSYALYTNGETVWLMSDGTNWQVVDHKTTMARTAYTATYSSAFGTSITGSCYYTRSGPMMNVQCTATLGTLANGSNATISLPTNANIDAAAILNNNASNPGQLVGYITNNGGNSGENAVLVTAPASSGTVVYVGNNTSSTLILTPTTTYATVGGNNAVVSSAWFSVPISGWRP
jgi:hypothetical protein